MSTAAPERARADAAVRLHPGSLAYVLGGEVGLRSSAGHPVWPVADEAELAALHTTVALFDGQLDAVAPVSLVGDGSSLVAGVGASVLYPDAGLRPLAELYAHLTSRVAKLAPLDRVSRAKPEIVVCLWDHLSIHVLETLQRATMRRPLGLIVAETPTALRVRLLRCAAAAALAPPARGEAVMVRGAQEHALPRLEGRGALGALVQVGRGDGLDAGELGARAIVLVTCFGVPSSDSLVPPAWSRLEGLLGNPRVACVATSLGVALPAPGDPVAIVEALGAGVRIGDALYRNPGLSREAHERCRMLLFGDPRTRPLRGVPRPPAITRSAPPLRRPTRPAAWSRDARRRFLGALIARAPDTAPVEDDAIADQLAGLAPLWAHWTQLCQPMRPTRDPASCPGCGRPGRSFAAEWQAGLFRVVSTCTRCGVFRDIEPGSALDRHPPTLCGTTVEIPDAVADARVVIRYQDEHWVLPRGRTRRQAITDAHLVPGHATLSIIYLLDLEMAAWQLAVASQPLVAS